VIVGFETCTGAIVKKYDAVEYRPTTGREIEEGILFSRVLSGVGITTISSG
jgi:hypothetical protein